jgi:mannose-6-phosphate isomerase
VHRPRRLRADNFTPPSRTPWGGTRILERYKADLDLGWGPSVVGESWEVSVEPSFPSRFDDGDGALATAIAADPEGWLGPVVAARHGSLPLLVKILDSGEALSLQVHPEDGDPALGPGESGKPEAWIVLDADPGAGLYLGFREGVDRPDVEACLAAGGALDALMNFVAVSPGDAFVIRAGTPHAIGAGVTLVEPQFVVPGRRGVTYRYWDWNRRYDAEGRRSASGRLRELHVARSLAVTAWSAPRGEAFVASCRAVPRALEGGELTRQLVVHEPWAMVETWAGTGRWQVPAVGTMWALTCLAGAAELCSPGATLILRRGQSAVVPAAVRDLVLKAQGLELVATRCAP